MRITKDTKKEDILRLGEKCNRCGRCCSYGSGFLLESEIPAIAAFLNMDSKTMKEKLLEEIEIFHTPVFKFRSNRQDGKPYGHCMFLQPDSLCQIHDVKPLHCRIGNCVQEDGEGDDLHTWFIVNYCLNTFDPESIRQYKSYIDTGGRILPGAELEKIFPDKAKLRSILAYKRFR